MVHRQGTFCNTVHVLLNAQYIYLGDIIYNLDVKPTTEQN